MKADVEVLYGSDYASTVEYLIKNATTSVFVSSYRVDLGARVFDKWSLRLVCSVIDAKKRGLDVKVFCHYPTPVRGITKANESALRHLNNNDVPCFRLPRNRTIHAKAVIVDDEYVVLGSHNWSSKSLSSNFELSILVRSPGFASAVRGSMCRALETAESIFNPAASPTKKRRIPSLKG